MARWSRHGRAATVRAAKSCETHETRHALAVDRPTFGLQLRLDSPRSVRALGLLIEDRDALEKYYIGPCTLRGHTSAPRVVRTLRDLQNAKHLGDGMVRSFTLDELVARRHVLRTEKVLRFSLDVSFLTQRLVLAALAAGVLELLGGRSGAKALIDFVLPHPGADRFVRASKLIGDMLLLSSS
jgi:hypothetical protein